MDGNVKDHIHDGVLVRMSYVLTTLHCERSQSTCSVIVPFALAVIIQVGIGVDGPEHERSAVVTLNCISIFPQSYLVYLRSAGR